MEEQQVLESWKEISAYLKRSEKTCRRWEASLSLPIHRLDGTPSARVFAYPEELDHWLAGKLHKIDEEPETAARLTRKKTKRLAAAGGAVLVLAAAAVIILLPTRLLPVPSDKPTLAVVPFEFTGGEAGLESWRTAFPDLLITDLLQSRYVTVLGITDLYRRLRGAKLGEVEKFSAEDFKKIADVARVKFIATGTIGKAGQDAAVTVSVRNAASGEIAKSIRATFRDEKDVFAVADTVAKDIRRAVGLTRRYIAHDIVKKVNRVSTDSPEAFKLFSRGYRLAGIAKEQEAIPILQKAVELDPKFALAYKYLFRSCQNALREDDEKRYALKAAELSGRLSERERGELLWLYYDYFEKDAVKKAVKTKEALERLCHFYPDDRFGSVQLLEVYEGKEQWDKALPVAERAWAVNKAESTICGILAECYENLGRGDKAERVLTEFINNNPDSQFFSNALRLRMNCYLRQGKFDAALGDIERLNARNPKELGIFMSKGIVDLYRHDFEGAERDFRKVLDQSDPFRRIEALLYLRDLYLMRGKVEEAKRQLLAGLEIAGRIEGDKRQVLMETRSLHHELAYLYRLTGQFPEALKEVEAALQDYEKFYEKSSAAQAGPPVNLTLLRVKALINLEMGKLGEFEKGVEEIRRDVERGNNPRLMRIYFNLLGHRELRNNNLQAAFNYFQKSADLISVPGGIFNLGADPEYFYPLAETYARFEPGLLPVRAIAAFERITLPTFSRLHAGDLYAKSLYQVAKLSDQMHLQSSLTADMAKAYRSKALENYRKFIRLWENADPIFRADVEAARTRLAALEAE